MEQLAILLLGSNLGNRLESIENAISELQGKLGQPDRKSSMYESAPWGKTDQPAFLNQVIGIRTSVDPFHLLELCLAIEKSAGRIRAERWGPRTIDIDILYYGDRLIDVTNLKVPHPGIRDRRFTLVPLCEIYPEIRHPESGRTFLELLETCTDLSEVNIVNVHA